MTPSKNEAAENFRSKIDEFINQLKETKDWQTLVPDYDEDSLMVHWTSKS